MRKLMTSIFIVLSVIFANPVLSKPATGIEIPPETTDVLLVRRGQSFKHSKEFSCESLHPTGWQVQYYSFSTIKNEISIRYKILKIVKDPIDEDYFFMVERKR